MSNAKLVSAADQVGAHLKDILHDLGYDVKAKVEESKEGMSICLNTRDGSELPPNVVHQAMIQLKRNYEI